MTKNTLRLENTFMKFMDNQINFDNIHRWVIIRELFNHRVLNFHELTKYYCKNYNDDKDILNKLYIRIMHYDSIQSIKAVC